jgi:hypothetical protein
MSYNKKQAAKLEYDHQDKALDKQRSDKGHNSYNMKRQYDSILDDVRKDEGYKGLHEKQLEKHHTDGDPQITEALLNDADKRDGSTWETNTFRMNELDEGE